MFRVFADRLKWSAMTFDEVHRVIKRGDLKRLRDELEDGLNPNFCNRYSWTILMLAAMSGNTPIGKLLIEKGADLNVRNKFGETALSLAVHTGHTSFTELLLRSGASLDCDPHGRSLDLYLDWLERYSGHKDQMRNIRELFERERDLRTQALPG
jgi:ankyrin repeat protein